MDPSTVVRRCQVMFSNFFTVERFVVCTWSSPEMDDVTNESNFPNQVKILKFEIVMMQRRVLLLLNIK